MRTNDCRICRDVKRVETWAISRRYHFVKCLRCGLAVGSPGTSDDAIDLWNEINPIADQKVYEDITGNPV